MSDKIKKTPRKKTRKPSGKKTGAPLGKVRHEVFVNEDIPEEMVSAGLETFTNLLENPGRNLESLIIPEIKSHNILNFLKEYLWFQDEALMELSYALSDHLLKVKDYLEFGEPDVEEEVGVVLLVGGTGTGKSESVRLLIKYLEEKEGIRLPYVRSTLEQFSSAGYTGRDIESVLVEVIKEAEKLGDKRLAEYAVVHLDELDKVITEGVPDGRDIGGEAVQEAILKLLDKEKVAVPVPLDSKTLSEGGYLGEVDYLDTKKIFFILSGAFEGDGESYNLEKIIAKRLGLNEKSMGFQGEVGKQQTSVKQGNEILRQVSYDDLSKYNGKGMQKQLQGRIASIIPFLGYTAEELKQIFQYPKNAIAKQIVQAFERKGTEVDFTPEAIEFICKQAEEKRTGARGLKSAVSNWKTAVGFYLESLEIKKFTITEETIKNPSLEIENIVYNSLKERFSKNGDFKVEGVHPYIKSTKIYQELTKRIIETKTGLYHDLLEFVSVLVNERERDINRGVVDSDERYKPIEVNKALLEEVKLFTG